MKKTYLISALFFLILSIKPVSSQIDTTGLTPLLDWPDIPGASYYRLQVATNTNFNSPVINVSVNLSQYQVPPNLLICNTLYYWRYRAYIGGIGGNWQPTRMFCTSCPIGINQSGSQIPDRFTLYQNYPNPFNPSTKIKFDIPEGGFTTITVYDELGREISVLVRQELSSGTYEVSFDGSNLSSGIYIYKITSGDYTAFKKMALIK